MEDGTSRGKLIGDMWTRLTDAAGRQAIPLLQEITKDYLKRECGKLSELSDEELRKLAQIPEAALATVAKALSERK